jgi:hypothetical protein
MSPPRFRRPTGAFPADGEDVQTPQPNALDAHTWHCWGTPDGPGAQRIAEVHQELKVMKQDAAVEQVRVNGELTSLNKRSWYQAGGQGAVVLIGMAVLAAWLSSKFAATERSAVKREDVAAAVQKGADMSAAKYGDDLMDLKKQIERAAVDAYVPPELMKARK